MRALPGAGAPLVEAPRYTSVYICLQGQWVRSPLHALETVGDNNDLVQQHGKYAILLAAETDVRLHITYLQ